MMPSDPQPDTSSPALHIATRTTASPADARTLGLCTFGVPAEAGTIDHPGLQPIGPGPTREAWQAGHATTAGSDHGVSWRTDGQLLFGHITVPVTGDDVAPQTESLYRQLFSCLERRQFPHLLRVWNYLPQINEGAGDAERYKAFCTGRAKVFDDHTLARHQCPAATAIGTRSNNELNVYFLAARSAGERVENPRQTNAPDYPRAYGPRSPRFARATAWPHEAPKILLVSGTASIVGHQSRHIADARGQLQEIWRNLEALQQQTGAGAPLAIRVYLRHSSDLEAARDFMSAKLPGNLYPAYLKADICRPELLVEVEGTYRI